MHNPTIIAVVILLSALTCLWEVDAWYWIRKCFSVYLNIRTSAKKNNVDVGNFTLVLSTYWIMTGDDRAINWIRRLGIPLED